MRDYLQTAKEFVYEEDAVGVVEIILILVVLISLVIIFKEQHGEQVVDHDVEETEVVGA